MGYKSCHGPSFYNKGRKEERCKDANQRNGDWQSLSFAAQITELDKRFGKGLGAVKQRGKIQKFIDQGLTHKPQKEKPNAANSKQAPRDAKGTQGTQKSA
jgi:hypothetical protein